MTAGLYISGAEPSLAPSQGSRDPQNKDPEMARVKSLHLLQLQGAA